MSFGPQLPPHLQKKPVSESESDSEDDQSFGPKLPSVPCRGPKPQNVEKSETSESDDNESYGPKLPKIPCKGPKPEEKSGNIGPQLPPGFGGASSSQTEEKSSSSE